MTKKELLKKYNQEEMMEFMKQLGHLFGFDIYLMHSPHGFLVSKDKTRSISIQSGEIELKTTEKINAHQKKMIAKLIHGTFKSEKKEQDNPKSTIYTFSFT